jgi:hypothetical protein
MFAGHPVPSLVKEGKQGWLAVMAPTLNRGVARPPAHGRDTRATKPFMEETYER